MPLDEFESVAFGKPFPDRETEWYPYESKVVRHITFARCERVSALHLRLDVLARYIGQHASVACLGLPYEGFPLGPRAKRCPGRAIIQAAARCSDETPRNIRRPVGIIQISPRKLVLYE